MSAPYWKLRSKVQDAVVAYILATDDPSIPVLKGFSNEAVTEPFVLVVADKMSPYIDSVVSQESATRIVTLSVEIRSQAEDVNGIGMYEYHAKLVGRVMDALNDADIVAALNSTTVEDLTIQQFDLHDETQAVEENSIRTKQEIAVVCLPS